LQPFGLTLSAAAAAIVEAVTGHGTGAFAVTSIRGGWRFEGRRLYPQADRMVITADGGGSHGSRLRLWKLELQKFADETGLSLSVCHFPPGTSKWNQIEHRLFSFISSNWRGEPLRDCETIVNLIARTTTAKGLKVNCRLDRREGEGVSSWFCSLKPLSILRRVQAAGAGAEGDVHVVGIFRGHLRAVPQARPVRYAGGLRHSSHISLSHGARAAVDAFLAVEIRHAFHLASPKAKFPARR
jgi:hypothetical protein